MSEEKKDAQTKRNHSYLRITSKYIELESEERYNNHIKDRGDSWVFCDKSYLQGQLLIELGEFFEKPSFAEAADVLNLLSMLTCRAERKLAEENTV